MDNYRYDLTLTDLTSEEANLITEGLELALAQLRSAGEFQVELGAPPAAGRTVDVAAALVERVEAAWVGRLLAPDALAVTAGE